MATLSIRQISDDLRRVLETERERFTKEATHRAEATDTEWFDGELIASDEVSQLFRKRFRRQAAILLELLLLLGGMAFLLLPVFRFVARMCR